MSAREKSSGASQVLLSLGHHIEIAAILDADPLDLVKGNSVPGTVVELGGARAFVRRHGLGLFQGATSLKISRDARRAEGMAAHLDERAEIGGTALDHAPSVHPVHRLFSQRAGAADGGTEEGDFAAIADAGRFDIGVEIGFKVMMCRHLMPFAAFLVQANPPALTRRVVVLDAHGDYGADAGEGKGHHADQRTIAESDDGRCVDAVQQQAGLLGVQHSSLAGFHDMLRAAHGMGRVGGDGLAGDQPVEQHADGS
jgi:hypothetical protein